jgi:hypothetical protein
MQSIKVRHNGKDIIVGICNVCKERKIKESIRNPHDPDIDMRPDIDESKI